MEGGEKERRKKEVSKQEKRREGVKDRKRKRELGEKEKEETKTEQECVRKAAFLRIYPTRKSDNSTGPRCGIKQNFPDTTSAN